MAENPLAKQIGPLPLGAWIAVVGGGLAIAFYAQRSSKEPEQVTLAEEGVGTGTAAFVPAEVVSPGGTEIPETLGEWLNRAIQTLINAGRSPIEAERALRKYAQGETLTKAEADLVDLVLRSIGPAPPGEITTIPSVEPPTPPTPPKPPSKPPVITLTSRPSSFKWGRSVVFRGTVTKDGKPVPYAVVHVHRKRQPFATHPWQYFRLVPTNSRGTFAVNVHSPDGHSYYVRFTYQGISVTQYLQGHS